MTAPTLPEQIAHARAHAKALRIRSRKLFAHKNPKYGRDAQAVLDRADAIVRTLESLQQETCPQTSKQSITFDEWWDRLYGLGDAWGHAALLGDKEDHRQAYEDGIWPEDEYVGLIEEEAAQRMAP